MPEIPFLEEEAMAYVLQVEQVLGGLSGDEALWVMVGALARNLADIEPPCLRTQMTLLTIGYLCLADDPG
jgi:hypothetical protein